MEKRVNTEDYWDRDGMSLRVPVLQLALMIESKAKWAVDFVTSEQPELADMVSWDFNKRIDFLKSLKAFNADERGKFTLFQNIRNKLLHVLEARTLVDCFRLMGKDPNDAILNLYPQDKSLPLEDQIHAAMQMLIDDIGTLLERIENHALQSIKENSRASHAWKGYECAILTMPDIAASYHNELKEHFAAGKSITVNEIATIPMKTMLMVRDEAHKRFRALLKERFNVDLDKFEQQGEPSEERV